MQVLDFYQKYVFEAEIHLNLLDDAPKLAYILRSTCMWMIFFKNKMHTQTAMGHAVDKTSQFHYVFKK